MFYDLASFLFMVTGPRGRLMNAAGSGSGALIPLSFWQSVSSFPGFILTAVLP